MSSSAPSDDLKASLIATYQGDMGTSEKDGMLRCMLLNTALPSELVVASHLFRRKNAFLCQNLMSFDDIDDVKNGLLLFRPLKHALGAFQVSFIYDKDSDEFRLKVLDPSLRRQRLFGKLDQHERKILLRDQTLPKQWEKKRGPRLAPGTDFDIQTTFGDIEGRSLCFMALERPNKRCLNVQARLARMTAIEEQWIQPDEFDFEDYWSDGMSVAKTIGFFFE
ncbi:hypothetical protein V7S43_014595 [Phytophthora oleae]|uniref:HNH nuclease domain-containing protein n=1 Tax=Phytophthora oleae TaxID=2107226 RepID=A0ABD3F149_9STRA